MFHLLSRRRSTPQNFYSSKAHSFLDLWGTRTGQHIPNLLTDPHSFLHLLSITFLLKQPVKFQTHTDFNDFDEVIIYFTSCFGLTRELHGPWWQCFFSNCIQPFASLMAHQRIGFSFVGEWIHNKIALFSLCEIGKEHFRNRISHCDAFKTLVEKNKQRPANDKNKGYWFWPWNNK